MRRPILSVTCIFVSFLSFAQRYGGNPSYLKWKQINTDSARIIFPAGLDSQANRIASTVHYLAAHSAPGTDSLALGSGLHKIDIVLQNQSTIANAYVGLGPYRSEFLLTPDPDNFAEGSIPWIDQLAVHEYRHVMQFNNFRNGLSKLMLTLFGEEGLALALNASVPDWFFEGDAVYNETILTNQGRGRLPLFLNAFPSLWQSKKRYSWMKLRNGSLKDYVPSHYHLGYLLVNYGREKFGADFWSKVTRDASAYKGLFYPFQKAVLKYSGMDYKTFRKQAFSYYEFYGKDKLTAHFEPEPEVPGVQIINPVNHKYLTNYYFPHSIGNDSLLYLKASFRQRAAFFIKDKSKERKLRARDISIDQQYSYRNGKIVYASYESDPRWGWRDYSVIKILDISSGRQQTLTRKTRYFTPDISPNGNRIAVVQLNDKGKSELHIIDAKNGTVLNQVRSAEIGLFTDPKFIDNNSLVCAVRLVDGKMALAIADLSLGSVVRLTDPSFNVIGYPSVENGIIYFTASFGGNDDVFALRLTDRKIFRITSRPFGNYFPNAANGKITWSAFTGEGYQLRQLDAKEIKWNEVSTDEIYQLRERYSVSHSEEIQDILGRVPNRNFPITNYKKATRLLNFHSWRPYYSDPIFTFSLYGENVLNTMQTELYYLYNQDEHTSAVGLNAVYAGWFPYLNLGTEYTFNREDVVGSRIRRWDQLDTRFGLSLPLSYASGLTIKNFNVGTYYVLRNEFNKGFFKDSIGNSNFSYLQHFISWSQQIQRAAQHIYPHLGYAFSAIHRHAITRYEGYHFIGNGSIYLPGILSNHNVLLTGSFQQRDTLAQVGFSNQFAYSRGYEGRYFSRMWRLSANYHFPLVYPDWGFGNILYLRQIRANAFYDFTKVYSLNKSMTRDQCSVGAELFFDTKWWNEYPVTFGIRVSRLLDRDQFDGFRGTVFEFVLPASIIPR